MSLDVERLKKYMLVMLSSDKPGEVMAASAMVNKALKKEGRDIHWLVDQIAITTGVKQQQHTSSYKQPPAWAGWASDAPDWDEQLEYCYARLHMIGRLKEREFIESLMRQGMASVYGWEPTTKQRAWLVSIYERVHAAWGR